MKYDCPSWIRWVVLIAAILYVAGDLGFGPGLWNIDVWHFILLMAGLSMVVK
ncbi:MAG: hypothetical protein Q8Q42_03185 [Nanoarchaeota archaeon]|nr:hypothetical protein [Nanoarchaeota archaeon]